MPAMRAKVTIERCGVVPGPVVAKGMLPAIDRALAMTSATVRSPEFGGVIITSGLWFTMQIGARSLAL